MQKAEWVSYIKLGKIREAQIQSCFKCDVEFHYPKNTIELEDIIEEFKMRSKASETVKDRFENENNDNDLNYSNSFYGENNKKRDRLIVVDDVSGLADISEKLASFLTATPKFGSHCVYLFLIILPERAMWISIISETNIFNIFLACVPFNSVKKILEMNCNKKSLKYVPQKSVWLNRLFIDPANKSKKVCLTINCSSIDPNGTR